MNQRLLRATAAVLMVTSSGCYSTWDVYPQNLTPLEGYRKGDSRKLTSVTGEEFTFDSDAEITTHNGHAPASSVTVKPDWVYSRETTLLLGAPDTAKPLEIDLKGSLPVQVNVFHVGATAGVLAGLGAAVLLVVGALAVTANVVERTH